MQILDTSKRNILFSILSDRVNLKVCILSTSFASLAGHWFFFYTNIKAYKRVQIYIIKITAFCCIKAFPVQLLETSDYTWWCNILFIKWHTEISVCTSLIYLDKLPTPEQSEKVVRTKEFGNLFISSIWRPH